MAANEPIAIEVCYALPTRQWLRALALPAGATVADALAASGLAAELSLNLPLDAGVHGRRCAPETLLHDGDRVEIYRPLDFDPMESRRRRAAKPRARR